MASCTWATWKTRPKLLASERIDIEARDILVQAGADTRRDEQRSQQANFTYSRDLLDSDSTMDPEDLGGSLSGGGSRSRSQSVEHVNSQIRAANIRLEASDKTRIEGAEVIADARAVEAEVAVLIRSASGSTFSKRAAASTLRRVKANRSAR